MKAIVYERYGSPEVLRLVDAEVPNVAETGVLVRVRAASVNPFDWHMMRGEPFAMRLGIGLRRPRFQGLGVDFAGQVEAVGVRATEFQVGDAVYGMRRGALAEVVGIDAGKLARMPVGLTFEQAAAVPLAAHTALEGLRDAGRLQPGEHVLVIGAGGGVGTFAVQLAKDMGARVTGSCSAAKVDLVRSLGADHVIDYTRQQYATQAEKYDVILQLAGTDSPVTCRRALAAGGRLVLSSGEAKGRWLGPIARLLHAAVLSPFVRQTLRALGTQGGKADLEYLAGLLAAGRIRPVIDRTYPLAEVPEAIRHLEEGHARGKIVITIPAADAAPTRPDAPEVP